MENNNNRKLTKKKTKYHIQNNHNMKINRKKNEKRAYSSFFHSYLYSELKSSHSSFNSYSFPCVTICVYMLMP